MSTRCRKNINNYLCKLYIVPLCEVHLGKLTVTFTYCADTFYLSLPNYIYYINNQYQSDIGKA